MTALPPITFTDGAVVADQIAPDKWEEHFPQYLLRRADFFPDIDRQATLLDHFAGDLGMGANGLTMLEGLDGEDRHKAKCATLRQWIGLQKARGVADMARADLGLGQTAKLVIYGVHRAFLSEVRDMLRDLGAVLLYDGTPDAKRRDMVRRFQADPKIRVFVSATAAVRPDVILANADLLIIGEASWKRHENTAAVLRVHNRYQAKPVRARFVGLHDSVDARLTQVLKSHCRRDVMAALEPSTEF